MSRPASRFIHPLSDADRQWLTQTWRTHRSHAVRSRAHAILLSAKGYSVRQLMETFDIDEDTARAWLHRWETSGRDGLKDKPRPGAPPKLDEDEQAQLKQLIEQHPSDPRRVIEELHRLTGKQICQDTFRRLAHKFGMMWKRFRWSLKALRNPKEFEAAREELAELSAIPGITVAYFDESTFSLRGGGVPYGWQPTGKRGELPLSGRRNVVHVLGFQSVGRKPRVYLHSGSINGSTVVALIAAFSKRIRQTTVLVLDNAKPHTCQLFHEQEARWAERGLIIYPLPKYSPELNYIEHLWQRVKYHELPLESWRSLGNLIEGLTTTFRRLGSVAMTSSFQAA